MIQVSPAELHRACALGRVRGPASPSAGTRSWQHEYLFEYGGGETLSVTATNNRVVLRAHLPVVGRGEAWRAALEAEKFDRFQHIDGGLMEVGPLGAGRLLVRRDTLRMPFLARLLAPDESGPWPAATGQAVDGDIEGHHLAACLRLLPTAGSSSNSQPLSWHSDGVMCAFERGLWFRVAGAALPFKWNLSLRDAQRVLGWLEMTLKPPDGGRRKNGETPEPRPMSISLFAATDGSRLVRLADPARGNEMIVPVASSGCPRYPLDRASAADAAVKVTVSRRALLGVTRLAAGLEGARPLRCEFLTRAGESRLAVAIGPADDPDFRDEVPVTDHTPGGDPAESRMMAVLPRRLGSALQRLSGKEVHIGYLPSVNLLSISPPPVIAGGPNAEVFIDARPAAVLEGGPNTPPT